MSKYIIALIIFINISCRQEKTGNEIVTSFGNEFVISFGSCNNQNLSNDLWQEIEKNEPDLFLWAGDIIYADGQNIDDMEKAYALQKNEYNYSNFRKNVMVMGTWDDHDYGLNDGGHEYEGKDHVQHLLLDFFDVPDTDPKRNKKGVYHSKKIIVGKNTINIIILDTRYFRTALSKDFTGQKRYVPNNYGVGSMLGEIQWQWLEEELNSSRANFNIIVSSIQFLSNEHGFETWGNMKNMNQISPFKHEGMGAIPCSSGVSFRVWASYADQVFVTG